jgi:hypothetical protein
MESPNSSLKISSTLNQLYKRASKQKSDEIRMDQIAPLKTSGELLATTKIPSTI